MTCMFANHALNEIQWMCRIEYNCFLKCTHMFSWIIIFPLMPRPENRRKKKKKKQTNKKISLIILEDTKVNMRCVSYVSVSEQMLEWWMIHNSWAFKQHVAVSTLHSEVRMWCVVWNHIGQSHCVTWSHI